MRCLRPFKVLWLLPLLVAGACGGGAPEAEPEPVTPRPIRVRIPSLADLDGAVASDGSVNVHGGPQGAGDFDAVTNGLGMRQFYSFDLSAIPAGATVLEASTALFHVAQVGSPSQTHGGITLERVDFGASLDASDFDVPAEWDYGRVIMLPNAVGYLPGGLSFVVTADVRNYFAASRLRYQLRVRTHDFDSDSDGDSDHLVMVDSEMTPVGSSEPPYLEVWYQPAPK